MKKFIITTTINEEIEAEDRDEAYQKFFKEIESEPQQTLANYLSDNLKIEEASEINCPKIIKGRNCQQNKIVSYEKKYLREKKSTGIQTL